MSSTAEASPVDTADMAAATNCIAAVALDDFIHADQQLDLNDRSPSSDYKHSFEYLLQRANSPSPHFSSSSSDGSGSVEYQLGLVNSGSNGSDNSDWRLPPERFAPGPTPGSPASFNMFSASAPPTSSDHHHESLIVEEQRLSAPEAATSTAPNSRFSSQKLMPEPKRVVKSPERQPRSIPLEKDSVPYHVLPFHQDIPTSTEGVEYHSDEDMENDSNKQNHPTPPTRQSAIGKNTDYQNSLVKTSKVIPAISTSPRSINKARAVFTVPAQFALDLIAYPILCRGTYFYLQIDTAISPTASDMDQGSRQRNSSSTAFLATEFNSPTPRDVAADISLRLSNRLHRLTAERDDQQNVGIVTLVQARQQKATYGRSRGSSLGSVASHHLTMARSGSSASFRRNSNSTHIDDYSSASTVASTSSPIDVAALLGWKRK
jgi:hypothetical protein